MSLKDDGSKTIMQYLRSHDKRISRLEKLVVVAIITNLPQLIKLFF